ncbi:HET-domain-containing protein [Hyaloscypha bicolor E]|uniref:HET-domain-containing protein n=1 Tax=Hyaloscypha bicolor E TaxID=1095630 RepID=A0A2J6T2N2_9HELO|nr:HET-domain-containing protein [Hyaloscypha bicolor E]PMD57269.1 HET-domain-containing protein [Hyaloscypha bicolor E]
MVLKTRPRMFQGYHSSFGVPQVIEDAITVVQKLGRQFLWVDKYCIKQWDSDYKESQIQVMDKIYEGAAATTVAAPSKSRALVCQVSIVGTYYSNRLSRLDITCWCLRYHMLQSL